MYSSCPNDAVYLVADMPRCLIDRHAERLRDAYPHRLGSERGVELDPAAQEVVRVYVAEHHVGVGDGGLRAAPAVAGRAGARARAARPHVQSLVFDIGDAPAACADRPVRDHRHLHPPPVEHGVGLVQPVPPPQRSAPRRNSCRPCRSAAPLRRPYASASARAPNTPATGPLPSRWTGRVRETDEMPPVHFARNSGL